MKYEIFAFLFVIALFLLGIFLWSAYDMKVPFSLTGRVVKDTSTSVNNYVNKSQIIVFQDKIVINLDNASLSSYEDTGSMLPLIDEGANGVRVKPSSPQDVEVGDIVSFSRDDKLIVHRVVDKGKDERGIYFITKGDNNSDREKVRFSSIKYKTIAIIY